MRDFIGRLQSRQVKALRIQFVLSLAILPFLIGSIACGFQSASTEVPSTPVPTRGPIVDYLARDMQQAVEEDDVEITLERIESTPKEIRAVLRIEHGLWLADGLILSVVQTPDGQEWKSSGDSKIAEREQDSMFVWTFPTGFAYYEQHGEWQLRVHRVREEEDWSLDQWTPDQQIGGPWIIRFEIS